MSDGLLLVERIVIESLAKKEKNIHELSLDTSLNHAVLLNILPNLLMNNFIRYNRGIYQLNKENFLKLNHEMNKKNFIKEEIKELFANLMNQSFNEDAPKYGFKLKKIWLSKEEEKHFYVMLNALDMFLEDVKNKSKDRHVIPKTSEETVVIWGHSQYSQLVGAALVGA